LAQQADGERLIGRWSQLVGLDRLAAHHKEEGRTIKRRVCLRFIGGPARRDRPGPEVGGGSYL
jgi:hypothetical protein